MEGAAILGAVAVVATVTAVNDYQKQIQFERLNAVAEGDAKVRAKRDGREAGGPSSTKSSHQQ